MDGADREGWARAVERGSRAQRRRCAAAVCAEDRPLPLPSTRPPLGCADRRRAPHGRLADSRWELNAVRSHTHGWRSQHANRAVTTGSSGGRFLSLPPLLASLQDTRPEAADAATRCRCRSEPAAANSPPPPHHCHVAKARSRHPPCSPAADAAAASHRPHRRPEDRWLG